MKQITNVELIIFLNLINEYHKTYIFSDIPKVSKLNLKCTNCIDSLQLCLITKISENIFTDIYISNKH